MSKYMFAGIPVIKARVPKAADAMDKASDIKEPQPTMQQPLTQEDALQRQKTPTSAQALSANTTSPYMSLEVKPVPDLGISIACIALAVVGIITLLTLPVAVFKENDMRLAGNACGVDIINAFLKMLGADGVGSSYFYDVKIGQHVRNGTFGNDIFGTFTTIIPIFVVALMLIMFVAIIVIYTIKAIKSESPKGLNVYAIINIVLIIVIGAAFLIMSNGEVRADFRDENVSEFFSFNSTIYLGFGIILPLICSVALIVLPYCCRRHTYYGKINNATKIYVKLDSNYKPIL